MGCRDALQGNMNARLQTLVTQLICLFYPRAFLLHFFISSQGMDMHLPVCPESRLVPVCRSPFLHGSESTEYKGTHEHGVGLIINGRRDKPSPRIGRA
ncbi:hypothetical protein P175DRAFT_0164409 [Aspergillus ochraceoroseus IBT 24754]|uniref:Uncharacterized protein n=1 Tax=Aspergillus ochraceoroseus IBT 24754 TaxID=1392256 RepID=A0A2T5M3Y4_9EURO|nr:uncharacterized protein P175DRAFT_0164409 [Aspergillus ochraceoroseus IBT 24754]PTU23234.1 hypothetical protein P175DRAFT_0164409 [Aspergillus ochraceoroseus IBT 24754]